MPDAKTAKTLNFLSVPAAGLLVLFFFLPWVKITCAGTPLAEVSGYQLSKGDMSPSGQLEQLLEQTKRQMEQIPGATVETTEEPDKKPDARPWFWLGLAIPVIVLLLGGLGAVGKLSTGTGGGLFVALGLLGVALMVCAMMLDFTEEFKKQQPGDSSPTATDAAPADSGTGGRPSVDFGGSGIEEISVETEPATVLWASMVLYGILVVFGVLLRKPQST